MKTSIITAAIAIIALLLCSCSFQSADGSSGSIDTTAALRAIEILSRSGK
jgi:hypothetical protein